MKKPLQVMKFGGTSVGDSSCIKKVVEIIRAASCESDVVIVVSAMSGVTNKLIEAATQSEAGNREGVAVILEQLHKQHRETLRELIASAVERYRISRKMEDLFQEGTRLCRETGRLGELTLVARDAISSLGERLSAPLVAATLAQRGVASEAVEATELIATDLCHGAADPLMDLTRERCEARLRPLLQHGIVPVVTGFIGATVKGVLTTLGRGGSDYSATILGAALDAEDVIIWTDVDGLMTADPRLVPGAATISEISYRAAAELAHFGARVLHPKTVGPVMECGIPLWIRNTFAPERSGTRVTLNGAPSDGGVKALTAINDVALITVGGPGIAGVPDILGRTFATTAAVRADVLLASQSTGQDEISLIVSSAVAERTLDALCREFAEELAKKSLAHIKSDATVAAVTLVGENMRGITRIVRRTLAALGRENVDTIAILPASTECNVSFVVAKKDMKTALVTIHREFGLGAPALPAIPTGSFSYRLTAWFWSDRPSAEGV
jgi:bifunctional aspartokinase / homoserine dehydrogenase 1